VFKIQRASKVKVESYSAAVILQAKNKCQEAVICLRDASDNKNTALISKALGLYLEAINLYPKFIEPYLATAYISWQMGKNADARKLLSKVLELEPANREAGNLLKKLDN
jgi:tetratricopeptide (TPR) repeat protein